MILIIQRLNEIEKMSPPKPSQEDLDDFRKFRKELGYEDESVTTKQLAPLSNPQPIRQSPETRVDRNNNPIALPYDQSYSNILKKHGIPYEIGDAFPENEGGEQYHTIKYPSPEVGREASKVILSEHPKALNWYINTTGKKAAETFPNVTTNKEFSSLPPEAQDYYVDQIAQGETTNGKVLSKNLQSKPNQQDLDDFHKFRQELGYEKPEPQVAPPAQPGFLSNIYNKYLAPSSGTGPTKYVWDPKMNVSRTEQEQALYEKGEAIQKKYREDLPALTRQIYNDRYGYLGNANTPALSQQRLEESEAEARTKLGLPQKTWLDKAVDISEEPITGGEVGKTIGEKIEDQEFPVMHGLQSLGVSRETAKKISDVDQLPGKAMQGVVGTAENVLTPQNLVLAATGELIPATSRPMALAFAPQMAMGTYEGGKRSIQDIKQGNYPEAAKDITETGLSGLMGSMAFKHGLIGDVPPRIDVGNLKEGEVPHAPIQGIKPEDNIGQYQGIPPRPDLRPNLPEVRQGEGGQAGDRGGPLGGPPVEEEAQGIVQKRLASIEPPGQVPFEPIKPPPEMSAPPQELPPKKDFTSIKNAQVDKELEEMGLPAATHGEKMTFEQARADAAKKMTDDPFAGQKLVSELQTNPRAVSANEDALLLHEQMRLKNERNLAEQKFLEAENSGDEIAKLEARAQVAKIQDDYQNITDVVTRVGTSNAQGLAFRRMMMREDYSLAEMEKRKVIANDGRPLTPEQQDEIRLAHQKIIELEKVHTEHVARIAELEREAALNAAHKRIVRQKDIAAQLRGNYGARNRLVTADRAAAAREKLRASLSTLQSGIDPSVVAPLTELGLYHFEAGAREFGAWSGKMLEEVGKLGEKIKPYLSGIWNDAKAKYYDSKGQNALEGLKAAIAQGKKISDMGRLTQELAKNFVGKGIAEREALIDAVHGELKKIDPNISRRETMDAISGYGQFKQLSKEEVEAKIRDLKGQMQQVSKLEDMQKGLAPSKTGIERRSPTDAERRLIQQVYEAKKAGGFDVTDPETQLKSALGSVKTRLSNQIADLETQIATGEKTVKGKSELIYDEEANALKARRDELKGQYDAIFGKRQLTDEQRVKIATAAVEKSIAEYERRIKTGDLFLGEKKSLTPQTPALDVLRARRDALKEELKHMQDIVNPKKTPQEIALQAYKTRSTNRIAELEEKLNKGDFAPKPMRPPLNLDPEGLKIKANLERAKQDFESALLKDKLAKRTPFEKMQDTFLKWRRAFILSSPTVFSKLGGAAIARTILNPVYEGIGSGLRKIIPGIAEKAPRHGRGLNVGVEARSLVEGFTTGIKDSWKIIKTGKSDLETLYGHKNILPREAIEFFGNLHSAMKAPVKRNEFTRSLLNRTEWSIRNGEDVHDPLIQVKNSMAAYKDAERSIFMQDNKVVDAYKRSLNALEQPAKGETHAPMWSKALATGVRTLLPIVKVPTNIAGEIFTHVFGTVTGSFRAARAYARGLENLKPEESDLIMRQLKQGLLGNAVLCVGYLGYKNIGGFYEPGKRDEKDVGFGNIKVGGKEINKSFMHFPLQEVLQLGATIHRVADSKLRKKDQETQGLGMGVVKALLGLTEEIPFVRETQDIGTLSRDPQRWAGKQLESLLVPQAVQWTARKMDEDKRTGEPVKRGPRGIWQNIQEGIPGLRNKLPLKGQKQLRPIQGAYQ